MKAGFLTTLLSRSLWLVPAFIALVASGAQDGTKDPMVGQKAPAFQVQGIYGENCSLEAFKGHILVMQFGASW
jgi:hypothetical protein